MNHPNPAQRSQGTPLIDCRSFLLTQQQLRPGAINPRPWWRRLSTALKQTSLATEVLNALESPATPDWFRWSDAIETLFEFNPEHGFRFREGITFNSLGWHARKFFTTEKPARDSYPLEGLPKLLSQLTHEDERTILDYDPYGLALDLIVPNGPTLDPHIFNGAVETYDRLTAADFRIKWHTYGSDSWLELQAQARAGNRLNANPGTWINAGKLLKTCSPDKCIMSLRESLEALTPEGQRHTPGEYASIVHAAVFNSSLQLIKRVDTSFTADIWDLVGNVCDY